MAQAGRKLLQEEYHIKDQDPKYIKELLKLNNKKKKLHLEMGTSSGHLTQEDRQMANRHMKKCSISCVFSELQTMTSPQHAYSSG
jgi:hypothetical protein